VADVRYGDYTTQCDSVAASVRDAVERYGTTAHCGRGSYRGRATRSDVFRREKYRSLSPARPRHRPGKVERIGLTTGVLS
jgi:hypothetical protein